MPDEEGPQLPEGSRAADALTQNSQEPSTRPVIIRVACHAGPSTSAGACCLFFHPQEIHQTFGARQTEESHRRVADTNRREISSSRISLSPSISTNYTTIDDCDCVFIGALENGDLEKLELSIFRQVATAAALVIPKLSSNLPEIRYPTTLLRFIDFHIISPST
ncbi:uncharacterized protein CLUP02_12215 [Colletotrichum lupini]|uniref:Uncharacterized protein n=1 Tax=Colletotrichum lupini TaxID=145971 RepID=A0A9Q8T024_9PEZI|nr:uncharacterized protein CLUP02_12215 [Colletotrichum lupini]UQC86713.1 hypothetical protein CLUP02_12215 [Colletotrichum lupini]